MAIAVGNAANVTPGEVSAGRGGGGGRGGVRGGGGGGGVSVAPTM